MISREEFYSLAQELEATVADALSPQPFELVFVAGHTEQVQSFRTRFEPVLVEAGLRSKAINKLVELPEDAPRQGPCVFAASGSVAEALGELDREQLPFRTILMVEDPLILTSDLPDLLRRGVLDVLAYNASSEELLAVLRRLGETLPQFPEEIIQRMRECVDLLERSPCPQELSESSQGIVKSRIANLGPLLSMAQQFYLGFE